MTRRCITIRLSPQCEIPAARTFKRPELVREVLRERGRFVSAALTIIRAWIVAGRPKAECKALAGFGVSARNVALNLAPLVVVIPLAQTTALFTLIFVPVFLGRGVEKITLKLVFGAVCVVGGSALIIVGQNI